MVAGDQDIGKRLVVPQQHVVARLQLLDHVRFKKQRLDFGVGGDELHRSSRRDHALQADRQPREASVVDHAVAQVARLADVERVALFVLHPVDARPAGQRRQMG